jgi:predicted O-linked N-acetylglucosamine transferase (SPINDLY family)
MKKQNLGYQESGYGNVNISYSTTTHTNPHVSSKEKETHPSDDDIAKLKKLFESDQDEEGVIFSRHLSEKYPRSSTALKYMGIFFLKTRKPQEAMEPLQKALSIDPNDHEIYANLAMVFYHLNNIKDAQSYCLKSVEINPNYAKGYANFALIQRALGNLIDAEKYYKKALALDTTSAAIYINFGGLLLELGRLKEAQYNYKQALNYASEKMRYIIYNNLGATSANLANNHDAQKYYNQALEINPMAAETFSNMLLDMTLDITLSKEDIYSKHKEYGRRFETVDIKKLPLNISRNLNEKLKVGFVSADLRNHPVCYFLESFLENLDRNELNVTLYSTNNRADEFTQRLQAMPLNWVNLFGLNSLQMAERINSDHIDILIDLSGHTGQNSLSVFMHRPAPIQASWIGYFNTTGLQSMDYIFCDEFVIPKGQECYYTEKPLRFDEGYLCFTPPKNQIKIKKLPALSNTGITFGCFNQLKKMGDEVVSLWAEILHKKPDSKLFLKSAALGMNNIAQQETILKFEKYGISPDRLIFEGRTSREEYFEAYNKVDIALDPFPYTGGTTTVDSLWMGVPVVTLQGANYASRMGVSILSTAGLTDWIAEDKKSYVDIVLQKANDLTSMSIIRKELRDKVLASPLCDAPRFARKFEKSLNEIWLNYEDEMKGNS